MRELLHERGHFLESQRSQKGIRHGASACRKSGNLSGSLLLIGIFYRSGSYGICRSSIEKPSLLEVTLKNEHLLTYVSYAHSILRHEIIFLLYLKKNKKN
jgi:hypothetical protein